MRDNHYTSSFVFSLEYPLQYFFLDVPVHSLQRLIQKNVLRLENKIDRKQGLICLAQDGLPH